MKTREKYILLLDKTAEKGPTARRRQEATKKTIKWRHLIKDIDCQDKTAEKGLTASRRKEATKKTFIWRPEKGTWLPG
jgi:hypothetical protein